MMYKKTTQTSTNPYKRNPKVTVNPTDKKNETHSKDFKNKDEQLLAMVKEYLQLNGYLKSLQILKYQKPSLRARTNLAPMHSRSDIDKNHILVLFDRGSRQDFFKNTHKIFMHPQDAVKKLEFQLNVYFCIYNIHPFLKRQANIDKGSSQAFKKYLDTKGAELSGTNEFISYFALAFMHKPQQNNALSHLFTKEWIVKVRSKLIETINNYLKSPLQHNEIQPARKISALQEMYHTMIESGGKQQKEQKEEHKHNCSYYIELETIRNQNKELSEVIQTLKNKFQEFVQSSKNNLVESGRSWFFFSRQIYNVARKYLREDKLKELDKYSSFFTRTMDEYIEANQISLFDKNSYNQDLSVTPDISKQRISLKKQQSTANNCSIDLNRIRVLFLQSNLKQKEVEICKVLKALRYRLKRKSDPTERRQVIIEYTRGDVCGVGEENYMIQKRLLLDSSERIKAFYVKLLEILTSNTLGLQYLSKSKKLVANLVGLFSIEKEDSRCRKPILGILQRLSFSKQPREQMVQLGIIGIIFQIFKEEQEHISQFTLQFLIAMMMNLSLKRESKPDFQKHKTELISLVIDQMDSENDNIRNYVNGTIFLLLTSNQIKAQARKQKLDDVVKHFIETREDDLCIQQYHYILNRLTSDEIEELSDSDGEQEEIEENQDEEYVSFSDSDSDDPDQLQIANGDELLLKNYALVGPQAVREQMLTKSMLDQTSKRLNNMTTSINRSRRVDNIFVQKNNANVLEPELEGLLKGKK